MILELDVASFGDFDLGAFKDLKGFLFFLFLLFLRSTSIYRDYMFFDVLVLNLT